MIVYAAEKAAGLEDAIKSNSNVAIASVARPSNRPHSNFSLASASADLIGANPDQVDLFYLNTLLVSCGWNDNDDVFEPFEIFKARMTPVDKKFNYNHDESDIIGHLTSSYITVNDEVIPDNTPFSDIGTDFDITVGAVLYKMWSDEFLQGRMDGIIKEIAEGKWFVSMEAFFPTFDYAAINTDTNEHFIIARNEESSHITKHLRCYGGTGVYDNYRVGRLLRNLVFCGKGLVRDPGNKKSLIKSYSSFNAKGNLTISVSNKGNSMPDTDIQVQELKAQLAKSEAKAQAAFDEAISKERKAYEVEITTLKQENEELVKANQKLVTDADVAKATIDANTDKVGKLEKDLADAQAELKTAQDKLAEIEVAHVKATRLAMFDSIDIDAEKAQSLVDKFASASDEDFAGLVAAFPVKKVEAGKEGKKEEKTSVKLDLGNVDTKTQASLNTETSDETGDALEKMMTNWVAANLRQKVKEQK